MARKKKSDLEAEKKAAATETEEAVDTVETTEIIDDSATLVEPSPKKPAPAKKSKPGGRTTKEQKKLDEETKPTRYRCIRGGRILHRGSVTLMRTGKVFKASDYNVPQLLQQGIELEELKD